MLICAFCVIFIFSIIKAHSPINFDSGDLNKNLGKENIEIKWDKPVLLNEFSHQFYAFPSTVYYDPVSGVNHILYADDSYNFYWYAAVSDEGKVLYEKYWNVKNMAITGLIRGPKDGKHLYLALAIIEKNIHKISYTESDDNGKTWAPLIDIYGTNITNNIELNDMIYIKETGRLFIFYYEEETQSIYAITKPPGSSLFSAPMFVCKSRATFKFFISRVTYNDINGRHILHLFFLYDTTVFYTESFDNGLEWTPPKKVSGNHEVSLICQAVSDKTKGTNLVSVSYTIWEKTSPAKFVYTQDFGSTFSSEFNLTDIGVNYYEAVHAMTMFGSKASPLMATFFATQDLQAEFAIWTLKDSIVKKKMDHPFATGLIRSEGLDFVMVNENEFKISAFVTGFKDQKCQLWFAHGVGTIKNNKD